jgi:hypothetical protein
MGPWWRRFWSIFPLVSTAVNGISVHHEGGYMLRTRSRQVTAAAFGRSWWNNRVAFSRTRMAHPLPMLYPPRDNFGLGIEQRVALFGTSTSPLSCFASCYSLQRRRCSRETSSRFQYGADDSWRTNTERRFVAFRPGQIPNLWSLNQLYVSLP